MRTLPLALLLVAAACGGKPSPQPTGRPEDVAKAAFEALKAGAMDPLESHLMTADESKRITGVTLDDTAERERLGRLLTQEHERLPVDWATAKPGAARVKMDAMGGRANVSLPIASELGSATVEIEVLKVGQRYVFQGMKPAKGTALKHAAPAEEEGEQEDGSGED
ncbi:MAG: hypothetical protein L6Q95_07740 [Planctomycetes bacterium]|nr:hypothetical protein [Planctomycetota bacterium]